MAQWYYSLKGKAQGPVTEDVLLEGLRAGRFGLVDLVFHEGWQSWRTMGEVPELRDAFYEFSSRYVASATPPEVAVGLGADPRTTWIVLYKRENGFDQAGPYTTEQLTSLLASGELQYSQYVWKSGFKRWVRLGHLPEFDRRKRDRVGDEVNELVPLPEAPAPSQTEVSLDNVVRLDRLPESSPVVAKDEKPTEAEGRDLLASSPLEVPVEVPEICPVVTAFPRAEERVESFPLESAALEAAVPSAPEEILSQEYSPAVKKTSRKLGRLFVAGMASGLVVIVALQALQMSNVPRQESSKAAVNEKSPQGEAQPRIIREADLPPVVPSSGANDSRVPENRSGAGAAGAAGVSGSTREPTAVVGGFQPMPPGQGRVTHLELRPVGLEGATPMVFIQTDAAVGQAIAVDLSARSGEILQLANYRKAFQLVRAAGEVLVLDLAKMALPQGTYRVRAVAGEMKSEAEIFVGKKDAQFTAQLEQHIKSIAQRQQLERKGIYYSAKRLEELARELVENYAKYRSQPAKWRVFYPAWVKQMNKATDPVQELLQAANADGQVYPDELRVLQKAMAQLNEQGKVLNQAIEQKRQVASQKPESLARELKRLKARASELKGRPGQ